MSNFPLALAAGLAMSAISLHATADEVSFQFSADLNWIDGPANSEFASMFMLGDTLSGSLTYDTALSPYDQYTGTDGTYSSFDFFSDPSLAGSLYINELSQSFQLDQGSLGIDGVGYESCDVDTLYENVASLQDEGGSAGIYLEDYDGGMLSTTDTLPADIDFNLVDYGELHFFGDKTDASAEITAFFLDVGNNQEPTVDSNGNLIMGATQPELFTLETGEVLQTNNTTVGLFENSTFVQEDGTHTTSELLVGGDSNEVETGQGTYLLQGGILNSGNAQVGPYGEGSFVQSGGTHNADWLIIGNVGLESAVSGPTAAGIGAYTLTMGDLNVGLSGMIVGASGQGAFNQSGGNVVIGSSSVVHPSLGQLRIGTGTSKYDPDNFIIDPAVQRKGTYTLGNGTLTVYGKTTVGGGTDYSEHTYGGRGEFNQTGGSVYIRDGLLLGEVKTSASGSGQYIISGGTLTVDNDIQVADNSAGGNAAEGLFFQTGGTVNVTGDIIIGESDSIVPNAYRIHAGTTTANLIGVGLGGAASGQALLEVSNSGQLTGNVLVKNNGVLKGDGTIDGNVTINGGMLAPGNSPGTMTILGDLILNDGVVEIEVGPSLSDRFIVGGDVHFGKDVLIDLIFDPSPIDTSFDLTELFDTTGEILLDSNFNLADSLNITGLDVGESLLVTLSDQQFTYTSAVPVPAAAWLFSSGLFGLIGVARRKKAA